MPRDSDKHNDSRGRRDRPGGGRDRASGGKGRSGAARAPDKKFAKRGFAGKDFAGKGDGDKRPYRGDREDRPPRRDFGDKPRFSRDDRPRGDRPFRDRPARDGEGGKRPFKPRGERRDFDAGDRPQRGPRSEGRSSDRKFGEKRSFGDREKRPYTPRGERDGEKRSFAPRGERAERKFDDRKFSRGDRDKGSFRDKGEGRPFRRREDGDAPRRDFGDRPRFKRDRDFEGRDRSDEKPWQKRDRKPRDDRGGDERPRFSRSRDDRGGDERPRFSRSRDDREQGDRPKFSRPRWKQDEDGGDRRDSRRRERPEGRTDWQEHPRSEGRFSDRPRRDNEDDSRIFTKRPAFGGRGAYRERTSDDRRERPEPKPKKSGERIAKVLARAGLASRRDAEEIVTQGRVTVNGRVINSPALDITDNDVVAVDGKPLPPRERTRLFMYHKPRGLMTTHADPDGRPTVFDNLPEGLPRLISIGRLDFNTEGLLLLTNDGGLARTLEHPDTGWLRRYRVRAHGEVTQAQLDQLKDGVEVDGVKYGPIDATLERDQSSNVWVVFAIREGKNREVRNVMAHLGLEVNRLIRISYGPFQLAELEEGKVEEVKTRVLREQLGEKIAKIAGADFTRPEQRDAGDDAPAKKPKAKRETINDRKGRRVLVQRTGSEEARARNEDEANGYGPPRRPKRGYHGKRDFKPQDE
ncbi:23S rRNA pseudouridine2605 synthase [Bradyrhizobium macuxiense]|uniref:Pseudouridine synthase n=1 Tax=Bradyrhizobium macuxiense TaxID=1755647 RepID=A0A560LYL8_9BRAD|nr:pseudouridine synthase [Bradyrhizobium macuxiense]TWC00513.1 23S rRNA pseudouridine2605 synthase [Bradyrhizobium macuxiense]